MRLFTLAILFSTLSAQISWADEKADDANYATVEGKILMAKGINIADDKYVRKPIMADKDKDVADKDKDFKTEQWVIDPKTRGLRDVFVWIGPDLGNGPDGKPIDAREEPFPPEKIHPTLRKPASPTEKIDQPCCRFIPHALGIRVGQELEIFNSAPIPHNAKFDSGSSGNWNPLLPANTTVPFKIKIKGIEPRHAPISLSCSIHPWMKAWIQVFDHPYFALTDAEGNFKISKAPAGKWRIYYWHESGYHDGKNGARGYPIAIPVGGKDIPASKDWPK